MLYVCVSLYAGEILKTEPHKVTGLSTNVEELLILNTKDQKMVLRKNYSYLVLDHLQFYMSVVSTNAM